MGATACQVLNMSTSASVRTDLKVSVRRLKSLLNTGKGTASNLPIPGIPAPCLWFLPNVYFIIRLLHYKL